MAEKKWKDYLLKSGLPLEYEIKELLENRNCLTQFEYSYLRPDENNVVNEFSFDLHAAYIPDLAFFDLLIECKYRHPSTNWVFTPEYTPPIGEIASESFIHVNDHFTTYTKHPFELYQVLSIAPVCSKGIEITRDGQNPKAITQATSQLAYAFAEAITEGMYGQYSGESGTTEQIFYHIPIIVTTANLYRLRENVSIEEIQKSEDLSDIATKEDFIMLKHHVGKDLERHNLNVFNKFISTHGKENLNKRIQSFHSDINHVCTVLAKNWCPQSIFVVQHSTTSEGFNKLFELMDELNMPTERTIPFIEDEEKQKKYLKDLADFRKRASTKQSTKNNIDSDNLPF